VNVGASTLATRSLTVDTGGVFDINLGTAAGDDFTVDTSAFVVSGELGKATFKNSTDSATGFQILDADGGTPILNVDTTNERVGIGTGAPNQSLEIKDAAEAAFSINTYDATVGKLASIYFSTIPHVSGYRKGAIFFQSDDASYGRGDMLFAVDNSTADTNIDVSDVKMTILHEGNVGIGVTPTARNNTVLQIKDGIGFPSTAVASTDANTLDDYEESTWEPTFTSTDATFAYNTQYGTYTKIGNVVVAQFYLRATASGTTTNNITMGLPFIVANVGGYFQNAGSAWINSTNLYTPLVNNNSQTCSFFQVGTTSVVTATAGDLSTLYVVGTITYMIDN